jgi:transcriptional regulator with XRE-family HTH domain
LIELGSRIIIAPKKRVILGLLVHMHKHQNETKGRADEIDHLVSKRLKTRRMMLGLSQNELSDALKVSIQQIQKYEKATNRISSGKLFTLSKLLQVPVSYFFTSSDNSSDHFNSVMAEDSEEYIGQQGKSQVSEKEVISLIRAFGEVKNPQVRKKILDLVKSMA